MALAYDTVDGVPLLRWSGPAGTGGAFSTRLGGASTGPYASLNLGVLTGDDPGAVAENRSRLCAAAGVDQETTACCRQIHSARVHDAAAIEQRFADPTRQRPEGDVLVARDSGVGVVVFAADCVPVLLARVDGSGVAACHAGWRGLLAGAVEAAVAALGGPCAAAIGPCAGVGRYDVGDEVAGPLAARFGTDVIRSGRADLARCAERALRRAGVETIDTAGTCTIADDRFFSHRRDGAPGGRQGAIAYRSAS